MAKQIKISELTAQVEEGWKIEKLAEFYELPINTTRTLLKQAGLTIKKLKRPLFELVDDRVEVVKDPTQLDLFQTIQESENTLETVVTTSEPIMVDTPEVVKEKKTVVKKEVKIEKKEQEDKVEIPTYMNDNLDTIVSASDIPEDILAEMEAIAASEDVEISATEDVVEEEDGGFDWMV